MKYRKKPVVVEAIKWTGDNRMDLALFMGVWALETCNGKAFIDTLEGTMTADIGDYIIKGVKDEFYPCKPDIFEQTYEKIDD